MINAKPKEPRVSASALDDLLSGPDGDKQKKELIEKFEAYFTKVNAAMNKGDLSPTEFNAAESMKDAIIQATFIVRNHMKL